MVRAHTHRVREISGEDRWSRENKVFGDKGRREGECVEVEIMVRVNRVIGAMRQKGLFRRRSVRVRGSRSFSICLM